MFVVMSGLPGSGKTTMGRQLGAALGLDVLDKDDFLEAHFADYAEIDSTLLSTLSRHGDAELRERALSASSAVLVSFWRREQVSNTAGTPTEWLRNLPNGSRQTVEGAGPPRAAEDRSPRRRQHRDRYRRRGTRDRGRHARPVGWRLMSVESQSSSGSAQHVLRLRSHSSQAAANSV
jgi:hypothetical protein